MAWNDAKKFCEWLSQKEDRAYVLPTEAQWEFACRAGTLTRTPFGDVPDVSKANVGGGKRGTCAVGSYLPNAFGLFDMIGNVYEFCQDDLRSYGPEAVVDPTGPLEGAAKRSKRGGTYSSRKDFGSVSRDADPPSRPYAGNGFRVATQEVAKPVPAPARR
jgi:formylglycine-generating enzyme required for sulfatase activity